jgi:shikimate kinase
MLNSNKVYIIGFMGSGKTTAGKKLASLLDWSFIDLDKRIEEHSGKTIPEIFSQYGENYFREVESEVLKSLESQKNTIISTGGGTPCFGDNMDYMIKTGLTLYLKLTPGQLRSRLSEATIERPLIKDLNNDELLGFIEEKLIFREKWYSRAEMIVDGFNLDINFLKSLVL